MRKLDKRRIIYKNVESKKAQRDLLSSNRKIARFPFMEYIETGSGDINKLNKAFDLLFEEVSRFIK